MDCLLFSRTLGQTPFSVDLEKEAPPPFITKSSGGGELVRVLLIPGHGVAPFPLQALETLCIEPQVYTILKLKMSNAGWGGLFAIFGKHC